ncbi:MAG: hypothetical protein BMS9Abin39_0653 [Ignavibacteria bacterium]|nr:MAG: hypothetical protein BMS9Abin39_0653 [Ignavibacteria bacterium]
MLKHKYLLKTILILLLTVAYNSYAQVSPEIQLAARGVMSVNIDANTNQTTSAINDFSDSGILLGFRQKLYSDFRGQFVFGMQFPDANSNLGQIFFHQTFLQIEDRTNILKLGRSRVASSLIEFPTLRDDDAIYFTDVLNPYSSGVNSEDNQYGNVFEYSHVFGQRYWLRLHGEHYTKTPVPPETTENDFSLNAIGLWFMYRVPQTQLWNRPILQQIGIGFNSFLTDRKDYTSEIDKMLKNVSLSAIVNLVRDPVYFVDLRSQFIYNVGFDEINHVTDNMTMTRAASISNFTSLRYLYRKLERPTLQIALSFGYKNFPDLENISNQYQLILNSFYSVGFNFDIGLQVQYSKNRGDMATLFGESVTRFQFALVYSISEVWNNQFDDRQSLLNLEHGYIP